MEHWGGRAHPTPPRRYCILLHVCCFRKRTPKITEQCVRPRIMLLTSLKASTSTRCMTPMSQYRDVISYVPERTPCIPHVGFHIQDIFMAEDSLGSPNTLPGGSLINFEKWAHVGGMVRRLIGFQRSVASYEFPPVTLDVYNLLSRGWSRWMFKTDAEESVLSAQLTQLAGLWSSLES